MLRFNLIIFDLDNTVYDWYSAFLPAFYDMVASAADALRCDREVLLTELQQVHVRHHDVEHPFSLIETTIVQGMIDKEGQDETWALLDPAFHAFNRRRKENLKLFPGTLEALRSLIDLGVQLVAYTDSKYFSAWGRIERLGLENIFSKIYCRERGASVLPRNYAPARPLSEKVVEIPSHESKPNPRVLADIVMNQERGMSEVAYVGDSLAKDVLMAKRAGCFAVWAKYGAHTDPAMYDRLIRISHWTQEDIQREKNYVLEARLIRPDFICERSLEELVAVVAGSKAREYEV